jgi:hypothetical protein
MSIIVIQPVAGDEEAVNEIITLNILVREEDVRGFDQIQVWRSDSTIMGPYKELTAETWMPALVPEDAPAPPESPIDGPEVVAAGTTLLLRLDDREDAVIPMPGPDPMSYADAAAAITALGTGRFKAYVTQRLTTGEVLLVLEGIRPGTGAVLEVMGGDAAPLFGLPTELPMSQGVGRDARINILQGKTSYQFVDQRGTKDSYYRTRFFNRVTYEASEFSQASAVTQAMGLSQASIVVGYLDLVQSDGRPLSNRRVSVYSPTRGNLVENKLVTGPPDTKLTDKNGSVQFTLVRGVKYTVAISGTDIVREIVAPEDPTVKLFPLLGADVGTTDDVFKVQVPEIVYAERRSL